MSLRKLKRRKTPQKKRIDAAAARQHYAQALDFKSRGQLNQAAAMLRKAIACNPGHTEALNSLGNTLHALAKPKEALAIYRLVCEQLPMSPQAHYNYGTTLFETGDAIAAIAELTIATERDPQYAEAHAGLGVVYQSRGQLTKAQSALNRAIEIDGSFLKAHRFLGLVLKDMGDSKAAAAKFTEILNKDPYDALSRYFLSRYTKFSSTEEAEVDTILSQLNASTISSEDATYLHFTLGKIYDDLELYHDAFHHYQLGNEMKRAGFGLRSISPGINSKQIKKTFTPALFKRFSGFGNQSQRPVFIVGMPRSGTTLVEQICASHSAVSGAGELKHIGHLAQSLQVPKGRQRKNSQKATNRLKYPQCLTTVQPERILHLANEYLNATEAYHTPHSVRVTDKMPTNFVELGFIRLLFPKAYIIHCRRDARDTCLSNFFQNFEEGNNCSFHLDEIALYYQKYEEVMDFWREYLPGTLYEIRYEELVHNSEEQSKKLIAYLELPWEEECLSFFKTKRTIATASDWQVRQPIYNKSVQRWKNYEKEVNSVASWQQLPQENAV